MLSLRFKQFNIHEKHLVIKDLHLKSRLWNDASIGIETPRKHGEDRNVATPE
jgi:hypothetical protein